MEYPIRDAKFLDANLSMFKRISDPCRGLDPVGNGDHHRRGLKARFSPRFCCFQPILSQKVITIGYQIREGFILFCLSVEVVFDIRIIVDVIKSGFVVFVISAIVTNNYTRRLDESGFDGIVESEIADDPSEQCLFRCRLPGWDKRSC